MHKISGEVAASAELDREVAAPVREISFHRARCGEHRQSRLSALMRDGFLPCFGVRCFDDGAGSGDDGTGYLDAALGGAVQDDDTAVLAGAEADPDVSVHADDISGFIAAAQCDFRIWDIFPEAAVRQALCEERRFGEIAFMARLGLQRVVDRP